MTDKKQPSDYRAKAEECLRMAEGARDPAHKQSWLQLAASWLRMVPDRRSISPAARPDNPNDPGEGDPPDRR